MNVTAAPSVFPPRRQFLNHNSLKFVALILLWSLVVLGSISILILPLHCKIVYFSCVECQLKDNLQKYSCGTSHILRAIVLQIVVK